MAAPLLVVSALLSVNVVPTTVRGAFVETALSQKSLNVEPVILFPEAVVLAMTTPLVTPPVVIPTKSVSAMINVPASNTMSPCWLPLNVVLKSGKLYILNAVAPEVLIATAFSNPRNLTPASVISLSAAAWINPEDVLESDAQFSKVVLFISSLPPVPNEINGLAACAAVNFTFFMRTLAPAAVVFTKTHPVPVEESSGKSLNSRFSKLKTAVAAVNSKSTSKVLPLPLWEFPTTI